MAAGLTGSDGGESRALTGLRGIGAVLVMCHHFYLHVGHRFDSPMLGSLLRRGYLGVDLFFVLSGFVLSMVYGSWFAAGATRGLGLMPVFLVRRVARLWPMHAAMVLVVLALDALAGQPGPGLHVTLSNLAMVQAWGFSTEINTPAWSVSTEFMAYLLFPVLAAPFLRGRMGAALAVACAAGALAVCLALAPPIGPVRRGWLDVYYNYSTLPLLRSLAGFVLGMAAWNIGRRGAVQRGFAALGGAVWVGPAALVLALALLLGRVNDLAIYPLLPVVVVGFHYGRGAAWQFLAKGPMHLLGVLSYAVYLIHFALLKRFPFDWGPFWEVLIVYLLATFGLAVLAHRLIELPGRAVLRRLGERAVDRLHLQARPG